MPQKRDALVFLIPEDYSGWVYVFYNVENGVRPETKNGKITLKIPKSGVLGIKNEQTYGIAKNEFFYYDENDNLTEIKNLWSSDIKNEFSGSVENQEKSIEFDCFTIGIKEQISNPYIINKANDTALKKLAEISK